LAKKQEGRIQASRFEIVMSGGNPSVQALGILPKTTDYPLRSGRGKGVSVCSECHLRHYQGESKLRGRQVTRYERERSPTKEGEGEKKRSIGKEANNRPIRYFERNQKKATTKKKKNQTVGKDWGLLSSQKVSLERWGGKGAGPMSSNALKKKKTGTSSINSPKV